MRRDGLRQRTWSCIECEGACHGVGRCGGRLQQCAMVHSRSLPRRAGTKRASGKTHLAHPTPFLESCPVAASRLVDAREHRFADGQPTGELALNAEPAQTGVGESDAIAGVGERELLSH
jgi:hypothetical protein